MASHEFAVFYKSTFQNVYRAAFAFTGDRERALDATQEAFSRAFARWARLGGQPWRAGWVMTTALNICRKNTREAIEPSADPATVSYGPEARVDLVRALRSLPPRRRTAAVLYYVADYPIAAVAELMGISEGTVKAHLAAARDALRAAMNVEHV